MSYGDDLPDILAQVDIAFVGVFDLSVDAGHPGHSGHDRAADAVRRIEVAASSIDKPSGTFTSSAEACAAAIGKKLGELGPRISHTRGQHGQVGTARDVSVPEPSVLVIPGSALRTTVAGLPLKNPVMAGSGEATMTLEGLKAAVDAGAGAVVAKSTHESSAARRQLGVADYLLLDSNWERQGWGAAPHSASPFCRSGLVDHPSRYGFARWFSGPLCASARHVRRTEPHRR